MKLDIAQIKKKMFSNSRSIKDDRIIEYIIAIVGKFYGVSGIYTETKSRKREYVHARQVAMYLICKYSTATLEKVGAQFAGKDHATVLHARKVVNNLMDTDKSIRSQVKDLESIIKLNVKAIDTDIDLNNYFYYIDFNDYTSIKLSNKKGIILTGFSEQELQEIKKCLSIDSHELESRKHENTNLYILEEKKTEKNDGDNT